MKKVLLVLLTVLMAVCFVSCGKEKAPAGPKTVHVATWDEFESAMQDATAEIVVLDADIAWNTIKYAGADGIPFMPDFTGRTLDLNGHAITLVSQNAFMLLGDSFTVKNGTITAFPSNKRYALVFNWLETASVNDTNWSELKAWAKAVTPEKYDDSDPVWAKRIVVENCTIEGLGAAYVTCEIKDCKITNAPYRALSMWGASGTVENTECVSREGTQYGMAIVNFCTVTLKGTVYAEGSTSFYVADGAKAICEDSAKVTLQNYSESAADRTIYNYREGYIYLGANTVVKAKADKHGLQVGYSSYTEIAKGAYIENFGAEITENLSGEYTEKTDLVGVSTVASFDYEGSIYDGQPADCSWAKVVDNRF